MYLLVYSDWFVETCWDTKYIISNHILHYNTIRWNAYDMWYVCIKYINGYSRATRRGRSSSPATVLCTPCFEVRATAAAYKTVGLHQLLQKISGALTESVVLKCFDVTSILWTKRSKFGGFTMFTSAFYKQRSAVRQKLLFRVQHGPTSCCDLYSYIWRPTYHKLSP